MIWGLGASVRGVLCAVALLAPAAADAQLGREALLDRAHRAEGLSQLAAHQRAQRRGIDEIIGGQPGPKPADLVAQFRQQGIGSLDDLAVAISKAAGWYSRP